VLQDTNNEHARISTKAKVLAEKVNIVAAELLSVGAEVGAEVGALEAVGEPVGH
jgi:hypothetical protein